MPRPYASRIVFASLLLVAAACGGSRPPVGASLPTTEIGAFVIRLGTDTVAVEEFSRSGEELRGRQLVRTPRTQLRDFTATLAEDGTIERFTVTTRDQPGGPVVSQATIEFGAETAVVRSARDGAEQTQRIDAPRGSLPMLGYSVALYEVAFAHLRAAELESLEVAMVPLQGTSAWPLAFETRGTDSVIVHNIAGENRVRVDRDGRLLVWDGRGTSLALLADRAVALDIDAMARESLERDAAGGGLGALSPRDSVHARVGEAEVVVAYGRPSARGRAIFGELVPWGEVWRTGANQATVLRTDADLVIGDTRVPAGTYSLFTIPSPDGWELIINRQHGQWGTEHDPAQDLARVPMQPRAPAEPVETFTISIAPVGDAAELRMAWDDGGAAVPVRAP